MAARKAALLIEAQPTETNTNTGFTVLEGGADRVDPIALAMDQTLGLETRPFSTMSRWNSHAIEFAWSLAPVVCDLFSLAVKACVELQLSWLSWIPGWQLGTAAQPGSGAAGSDQLAESMDAAMGAQPARSAPALLPSSERMNSETMAAAAEPAGLPAETAMVAGGMR